MRIDADRFDRFCVRHAIRRADIVLIYVLATGYATPLHWLLRAFVQGRSSAAVVAGRVRTVPVVPPLVPLARREKAVA